MLIHGVFEFAGDKIKNQKNILLNVLKRFRDFPIEPYENLIKYLKEKLNPNANILNFVQDFENNNDKVKKREIFEDIVDNLDDNSIENMIQFVKNNNSIIPAKENFVKEIVSYYSYNKKTELCILLDTITDFLRFGAKVRLYYKYDYKKMLDYLKYNYDLNGDFEIAEIAVEIGFSLAPFSKEIRNNRELALKALYREGGYQSLGLSLKNDKELALKAIQFNSSNYQYVSDDLKDDSDILKLALDSDISLIEFASSKTRNKKNIMKEIIEKDGSYIKYAGSKIKKDKEVALIAVKNNKYAYRYLDAALLDDEEIKKYIPKNHSEIWYDESESANKIQKDAPTDECILQIEKMFGDKFPEEYINMMKEHNGGRLYLSYYKLRNSYRHINTLFPISQEENTGIILNNKSNAEYVFDGYEDDETFDYIALNKEDSKEITIKDLRNRIFIIGKGDSFVYFVLDYGENEKNSNPSICELDIELCKVLQLSENFEDFINNLKSYDEMN